MPQLLFAQDDPFELPNEGCDPYDTTSCPIDTWVVGLAIVTVLFAVYKLSKTRNPSIS